MSKKKRTSIDDVRDGLAKVKAEAEGGSTHARRKIRTALEEIAAELGTLNQALDKAKHPGVLFDPSRPSVIGRFAALALIAQNRQSFTDMTPFFGSGIYAIYYTGDLPVYSKITGTETPVYVGKADPERGDAETPKQQGTRLIRRLGDHRKNIGNAFDVADFQYRALVVQSGWQNAAEAYLINLFKPAWNLVLSGLGKHGDAPTTRGNTQSTWDTLHPGRAEATARTERQSVNELEARLAQHFVDNPPFKDTEAVLRNFFDSLKQV